MKTATLNIYRRAENTFKGELLFVLKGTITECIARAEKEYGDKLEAGEFMTEHGIPC